MITNTIKYQSRVDELSLKTYGPRREPIAKEFMNKDEMIAMSPLGSTQPTDISKRYANHRQLLPPILKKALNYLFPAKCIEELPPKSNYDIMVRKMSNFSLQQTYENRSRNASVSPIDKKAEKNTSRNASVSPLSKKKEKKSFNEATLVKKMSGIFDFPLRENEVRLKKPVHKKSK